GTQYVYDGLSYAYPERPPSIFGDFEESFSFQCYGPFVFAEDNRKLQFGKCIDPYPRPIGKRQLVGTRFGYQQPVGHRWVASLPRCPVGHASAALIYDSGTAYLSQCMR